MGNSSGIRAEMRERERGDTYATVILVSQGYDYERSKYGSFFREKSATKNESIRTVEKVVFGGERVRRKTSREERYEIHSQEEIADLHTWWSIQVDSITLPTYIVVDTFYHSVYVDSTISDQ